MKDKDPFIDWYQQQFDKLNEPPPDEAWDAISENLNINEAWQEIDGKLNSIARRKVIVRRSIYATSLLLLLLFSGSLILTMFEESGNKKTIFLSNNKITAVNKNNFDRKIKNETIIIPKKQFPASIPTQNKRLKINSANTFSSSLNKKNDLPAVAKASFRQTGKKYFVTPTIVTGKTPKIPGSRGFAIRTLVPYQHPSKSGTKKIQKPENISMNNIAEELFIMPIRLSLITKTTPLALAQSTISDSNYLFKQPASKSKFHGLYAGGILSLNNVWLLNNQTFNGFKSTTLDKTNLSSGSAYGISAGYNFCEKLTVELNWYLQSKQGQTYHVYNEGKYRMNSIKLNYMAFSLAVKHRNEGYSKWFKIPKSHNFITGVNFGLLKEADNNFIAALGGQTKSLYSNIDYGLRIGYEYEILAFKRVLFSSVILADFGLKNIYKGTSAIPGSFNRTHTASLGLQASIKYVIR